MGRWVWLRGLTKIGVVVAPRGMMMTHSRAAVVGGEVVGAVGAAVQPGDCVGVVPARLGMVASTVLRAVAPPRRSDVGRVFGHRWPPGVLGSILDRRIDHLVTRTGRMLPDGGVNAVPARRGDRNDDPAGTALAVV